MAPDGKKPGESEEDFEDLWMKNPGKDRDEDNMPEYKFRDDNRRTFLIIASIVTVFLFGGILWYLYYQKNLSEPDEVPLIKADADPVKSRPDDPGGMEVPHQDRLIYDKVSGEQTELEDSVQPTPEEPIGDTGDKSIEDLIAETEPEKTAEADEPVKAYIPERDLYLIQLGAFSDEAKANRAWGILKDRYKSVLGDLTPNIQEVTLSGGQTLYRLRAGFFAGKDKAEAMCKRLKELGQECLATNK